MAGPEKIPLSLDIEIRDLKKKLAEVPGVTKEAAAAMVREMVSANRAMTKAAEANAAATKAAMQQAAKATQEAAEGARSVAKEAETLGDAAGTTGGNVAKLAGALEIVGGRAGGEAARAIADVADVAEVASVAAKAVGISAAALGAALAGVAVVGVAGYLVLRDLEAQSKALQAEVDAGAEALDRMKGALEGIRDLEDDLDLRELKLADPNAAVHLEAARKAAEKYAPLRAEVAASIGKEKDALAEAERALAKWNKEAHLYAPDVAARKTEELTAAVEDHGAAIGPLETQLSDLTEAQGKLAGRLVTVAGLETAAGENKRQKARATKDAAAAARDEAEALREVEEATRAYSERLHEEEAAGDAQRAAYDAAVVKLGELAEAASAASMTAEERLLVEHQAALGRIDDLRREALAAAETATGREVAEAEANAAILAERERYQGELDELSVQRTENEKEAAKATRQAWMSAANQIASAASGAADEYLSYLKDKAERAGDAAREAALSAGASVDEAERKAEKAAEQYRKRVETAHKLGKALRIAEIAIATASAAMTALGPPPTGLGPLLGAPLAAAMVATGAVQAGVVAATPLEFHTGGTVDEVPATLLRGEAVLSRRGRRTMGDDAIDAANAGRSSPGPVIVVENRYKHRVFDRFVQDSLRMPTSNLRRALRTGRRAGHRAR